MVRVHTNEVELEAVEAPKEEATATVVTKDVADEKVKAILNEGKKITNATDESILGSKSKDIQFVSVIINNYRKSNKLRNGEYTDEGVPCGMRLKNAGSEPIEYFQSKVTNKKHPSVAEELALGIAPARKTAQPGEEFDVAFYDLMELVGRPEYGAYIHAPGLALNPEDAENAYVKVSLSSKLAKGATLPTVKYTGVLQGVAPDRKDNKFVAGAQRKLTAVKDVAVYLAPTGKGGIIAEEGTPIKPEFADQFGVLALAREATPRVKGEGRAAGTKQRKANGKNVDAVSIGLSSLLRANIQAQ